MRNVVIALVVSLTAGGLFADSAKITGEASVVQTVQRLHNQRSRQALLTVPVTIDLTRVFVNGHNPVLGAYVARIDFDASAVQFLDASGGSSSYFSRTPFATNAATANAEGTVRVCYVQTDSLAPSGVVNVAAVHFRELAPNGARSIKVTIESLAAALERDADGNLLRDLAISVGGDQK